jgi:cob(I)alamin adenosyltransferase
MVHLTRIYTKTGDDGTTGIANNERVYKISPLIEAIGAVDEANSAIGMSVEYYNDIIERIQNDLFDLGAELAGSDKFKITDDRIEYLEKVIDDYNEFLEPLRSFVLPTGSLHNARTVVRRAERAVWMAIAIHNENDVQISKNIPKYLNRLSDLLFVMARYHNKDKEKLWVQRREENDRQDS